MCVRRRVHLDHRADGWRRLPYLGKLEEYASENFAVAWSAAPDDDRSPPAPATNDGLTMTTELTRRELLRGATLSAGALIRFRDSPVDIAAQAVSAATVRILFLPRGAANVDPIPNDRALVRSQWTSLPIGKPGAGAATGLEVEVTRDLTVRVRSNDTARSRAPGRFAQRLAIVPARPWSAAWTRRRRAAVRSEGLDRRDEERSGRVPPAHARRPRADSMDRRHGRLGTLRPSSIGHVRFHGRRGTLLRRTAGSARPVRRRVE